MIAQNYDFFKMIIIIIYLIQFYCLQKKDWPRHKLTQQGLTLLKPTNKSKSPVKHYT